MDEKSRVRYWNKRDWKKRKRNKIILTILLILIIGFAVIIFLKFFVLSGKAVGSDSDVIKIFSTAKNQTIVAVDVKNKTNIVQTFGDIQNQTICDNIKGELDRLNLTRNGEKCQPNFACSEWSKCIIDYGFGNYNDFSSFSFKTRVCEDKNECIHSIIEKVKCNGKESMRMVFGSGCRDGYIEVFDSDNNLVSLLKVDHTGIMNKLDINMIFDKDYKCPYCYDKIKDFDEQGIDCGGKNCPACEEIALKSFKGFSFPILYVLIIIIPILLYFIISLIKEHKNSKNELKKLLEMRGNSI